LPYSISRPNTSISKIVGNFKVCEKARIKKIFILDRGKNLVVRITPEEALRRMLIINRNEFSYHKNSVLFAYSYFNPSLNLDELMGKEQEILRTLASKSDCYVLKANDPKQYIDLLTNTLK
jgi:hypothetical protein